MNDIVNGKKDKNIPSFNQFQTKAVQRFNVSVKSNCLLVLDNNNIITSYLRYPDWDILSIKDKLMLLGSYLEHNDGFKAFTLIPSHHFRRAMKTSAHWADYARRHFNSNLKNNLGFVPDYMFVIETSRNDYEHFHGVIDVRFASENTIRDIFKKTVFGCDYKTSPMNRVFWEPKCLYNPLGWISYCLKNNQGNKSLVYMTNSLKKSVKIFYSETYHGK